MTQATCRLDDAERARRLRVLYDLAAKPWTRVQADVDDELRQIRLGRRTGWRRPSDGSASPWQG